MDSTTFLFVSPHLDDAIFSCGGYAYQLASAGQRVIIATFVTADASGGSALSSAARRDLRCWGGGRAIFARRCSEDVEAAEALGASTAHLGLLDATYRQDENHQFLYADSVLAAPVHSHDVRVFKPAAQRALAALLLQYSDQTLTVVCPLSIGGHVDHRIIRQVVEALTSPHQRLYYEDFPYALHGSSTTLTSDLAPITIKLRAGDVEARLAACASYRSQLPTLFHARLDIPHLIRRRFSWLAPLAPVSMSLAGATRRMRNTICEHIQQIDGECYWKTKS